MSWRNNPATEKQIKYLTEFGYVASGPLSKGEASDLISQLSEDPERRRIRDEKSRQDGNVRLKKTRSNALLEFMSNWKKH